MVVEKIPTFNLVGKQSEIPTNYLLVGIYSEILTVWV